MHELTVNSNGYIAIKIARRTVTGNWGDCRQARGQWCRDPTIKIMNNLNSNCQLPKPGDRGNFNTHKTCWECRNNDERPTEKKNTNIEWDDGEKSNKGKLILTEIFQSVHETWYLKV